MQNDNQETTSSTVTASDYNYPSMSSMSKNQKKFPKKLLYIIISILAVVIVAAGTAFVLLNLPKPSTAENVDNSTQGQLTRLLQSSNSDKKSASIESLEITSSGTADYKNAKAKLVSDRAEYALFYQTPDSTWHYFTVTENQDMLSCSDYNSDDLLNSYVGFTCQNTTTNKSSYVEKPNPTFEVIPGALGG